jgi:hypothetical protein
VVERWREQRAAKNDKSALNQARVDKLMTEIQLAELELARERQKLIPREVANAIFTNICDNAKARLGPLGSVIAPQIVGLNNVAQIRTIIDDEVYDALTDLAEGKRQRTELKACDALDYPRIF